jgi:folate-binding protein YgfZ
VADAPLLEAATKTGVAYRPAERRWISVTGSDAASHLQAMCTQDLGGQAPGEARFAALADDRGRYLADFWVIRVGDDWRLDAAAALAGFLVQRLNMFAVSADTALLDLDETHALFHLEGPAAGKALGSLLGDPTREPVTAAHLSWRGAALELCPRSHFGERGYSVLVPRALESDFGERLSAVCRESGLSEIGEGEAAALRVLAGRPLGSVDMSSDDLLQETGLLAAISLTKGCYPGQEILQRVARQGKLRKRLTGFRAKGVGCGGSLVGSPVLDRGGDEVGRITSEAPHGDSRVGLGWLTSSAVEHGRLMVGRESGQGVEIADLPFVPGSLGPLPEVPQRLPGQEEDR